MRYTTYCEGIPVIQNKDLLNEAIRKLAEYENEEGLRKMREYCQSTSGDCLECILKKNNLCVSVKGEIPPVEDIVKATKIINELHGI